MRPKLEKTADLVTFTEEIFNEKLPFSCNVTNLNKMFFYLSDSGLILDLNTVL